jgi:hypothetical protein
VDAVVRCDGGQITSGISGDTFGSLCMGADGVGSGGWVSVSTNGSLGAVGDVLGSAIGDTIYGGISMAGSVYGGSARATALASSDARARGGGGGRARRHHLC